MKGREKQVSRGMDDGQSTLHIQCLWGQQAMRLYRRHSQGTNTISQENVNSLLVGGNRSEMMEKDTS